MIQPNEIRLNNWVLNDKGEYKQIKDICEDGSVWLRCNLCVKAKYRHKLEGLNPIPLTEDVLLKCGFWEEESNSYYHVDFEYIYKDNVGWHIFNRGTKLYIESLHRLQNLHFALTNQELEIEL